MIVHMVGNAHLDPAWMWQWGEGMEAFLATCRAALDRMDETPDFVFTCSSAAHYRWVEEVEPELFERIRARVAEGRWTIVGGWWTQADCNLPSGEGFTRQALLAQRYFLDRFGRIARTGYSPDAFGHNLGLPQLLAKSGMSGYIFCRPDPTELTLPSPLFEWRGPDGSSVLGYRVPLHYNMYETTVPKKVADLTDAYRSASPLAAEGVPLRDFGAVWSLFYGVGNHGGGPTKEHIAQIIEIAADPDRPDLCFSDPDRFFEQARAEQARTIPAWSDDLQLNAPGCYSAHSLIKKLNRESEHRLVEAEKLSALASILLGVDYPAAELRRAWECVCFNHFHDILCGVAIREALDDAIGSYGEALSIARRSARYAVQRLARSIDTTGPGQTLIVFNTHSWPVEDDVTFELWHDIDKALWSQPIYLRITYEGGAGITHQLGFTSGKIGRDRIAATFRASVPALGWRCYRVHYGERSMATAHIPAIPVAERDRTLENDIVRVEISPESGAIERILHKRSGREILAGAAGLPVPIEDRTDTWGHGVTRFDQPLGAFGHAEVRLVEEGPTHRTIRSLSRFRSSWIQQDFRLAHDSDAIHVSVKIFWAEPHAMLKLRFHAASSRCTAIYESAYCATQKPCDGTERPGGAWAAIVGEEGASGIGIANDAKHGYDALGSILSITALRSPSYATHDPHPYHPDEDLDFLDLGVQRFRYVIVPIIDDAWKEKLAQTSALLNAPLIPHFESAHAATGARAFEGMRITPSSVTATVLKRSEDERGWIVRLYETTGVETEASIVLDLLGQSWRTVLHPHEVKTFLLSQSGVTEVNLIEME